MNVTTDTRMLDGVALLRVVAGEANDVDAKTVDEIEGTDCAWFLHADAAWARAARLEVLS